jgi:hypothetical protein
LQENTLQIILLLVPLFAKFSPGTFGREVSGLADLDPPCKISIRFDVGLVEVVSWAVWG